MDYKNAFENKINWSMILKKFIHKNKIRVLSEDNKVVFAYFFCVYRLRTRTTTNGSCCPSPAPPPNPTQTTSAASELAKIKVSSTLIGQLDKERTSYWFVGLGANILLVSRIDRGYIIVQ